MPYALALTTILAVAIGLIRARAQQPSVSLDDQLKSQYRLARIASGATGWTVVEAGTVLVIQKPGIVGVPPDDVVIVSVTYKNGKLNGPGFGSSFLRGFSTELRGSGSDTRSLTVGEKVY